jgi:hypothetical protein
VTQDQVVALAYKAAEVVSVSAIAAFIVCYTMWASWWRDPIGRTIVIKDVLLLVAFVPPILSMFLHFNRFTSFIAAWVDIAMVGLIGLVMIWRIYAFWKIHKSGRRDE